MFKNGYQGGNFFEIFSAQGKDPTGEWKLQGGSGIRKIYEKEVKSFVYNLEGTVATTKMQIPNQLKHSLSLVQRYLIFQLNVPKGGEFSLEIGITDIGNNKRRLNMSTSVKEITVTPLHAKLPLTVLKKSMWVNCCCDMVNIVSDIWHGQTFGKVDSLTISANCKLRRIITMKQQPHDTTDDDAIYGASEKPNTGFDAIPRQHQLAADVKHYSQLLNMHKIRAAEIKLRGDRPSPLDLDLSSSGRRSHLNESFHIAFGTKVGKPPTAGVGRKSTSSGLPSHRDSMRASAGGAVRDSYNTNENGMHPSARLGRTTDRMVLPQTNGSGRQRLLSDPGKLADISHKTNNPLNESRSWSGTEMQDQKNQDTAAMFAMPHPPPRDNSAEAPSLNRRRQAKIRSGERQHRTPADAHLKPITDPKQGHHHTVSAPAAHYKPTTSHAEPQPLSADPTSGGSKLAPLNKLNKLAPLGKRGEQPVQSSYEPQRGRGSRPSGLQPLESRDVNHSRRLNVNNHNSATSGRVPPNVWGSQTQEVIPHHIPPNIEPWYQQDHHNGADEESVSDVIDALRGRMNPLANSDLDSSESSDDDDRNDLIDSLEKFSADKRPASSSSEEDSSKPPSLFQFRSPPKAANRLNNRTNGAVTNNARKQLQQNFDGIDTEPHPPDKLKPLIDHKLSRPPENHADRPSELSVYNSVYNPSAYKQLENGNSKPEFSPIRKPDLLEPRPPDSPRPGSRPGSGRLRSRHGSRASNHSNKPTPDSSGTGDDLTKHLRNNHTDQHKHSEHIPQPNGIAAVKLGLADSPGSSGNEGQLSTHINNKIEKASRRILKQGDDLSDMPSPRTSDKEPRLSSAGIRGGSADSKQSEQTGSSGSSREDLLMAPNVQLLRTSDRAPSPLSSRGSTRLSRKSLREIPDTDERLVNAQVQYSSSPTRTQHEPAAFHHVDDTFDEERMLQFLKREQELGGSIDEQNNQLRKSPPKLNQYEHQGLSDGEHSSGDESFMTTSVPVHDYGEEMQDTLERSDTRDNSMFSPPIVIASQRKSEEQLNSSYLSRSSKKLGGGRKHKRQTSELSTGRGGNFSDMDDEPEEELDLLYDPVLNCYYDPDTHKYYELV